jgi:hypothetical protein
VSDNVNYSNLVSPPDKPLRVQPGTRQSARAEFHWYVASARCSALAVLCATMSLLLLAAEINRPLHPKG